MKPNRFKQVLSEGRVPVGHMLWEFTTRGIAKILESAGVDFVLIDMEHTACDVGSTADVIAWLKATSIAPFVRVPQGLYHFLARAMDSGALGVMVPDVRSASQAEEIVKAVKYAPQGARGVGLGTAHTDYLAPDPAAYFEESNRNTTVICQIESTQGLDRVDAIAATQGVDVLWVGHFDLTQSMGIPGQFQAPAFLEALQWVVAAARRHGKAAGIQPFNPQQAERWLALGFNVISWGTDVAVYQRALQAEIAVLRTIVDARSASAGKSD